MSDKPAQQPPDPDILDVRKSVIEAIRAALVHTDGNVVLSQEAAIALVSEWDELPEKFFREATRYREAGDPDLAAVIINLTKRMTGRSYS